MTTFVFALLLLAQIPVNRSLARYKPETFLDKGLTPPLPAKNRDENLIKKNLEVIAHMCKKYEVPDGMTDPLKLYTCSCSGEALSALTIAADLGEPTFTRVAGLYAIAIAAKQGCRDDSLVRAVLIGLQSEPPVDVCTQTILGDFVAGAITEMPCTVFDNGLNVVEAAVWAAVYFGPPRISFNGPFTIAPSEAAKQFKSALEHIAADTDEKRHGITIAAAKEALGQLGQ